MFIDTILIDADGNPLTLDGGFVPDTEECRKKCCGGCDPCCCHLADPLFAVVQFFCPGGALAFTKTVQLDRDNTVDKPRYRGNATAACGDLIRITFACGIQDPDLLAIDCCADVPDDQKNCECFAIGYQVCDAPVQSNCAKGNPEASCSCDPFTWTLDTHYLLGDFNTLCCPIAGDARIVITITE